MSGRLLGRAARRRVITVNGGHRLSCCWDDCDRPAHVEHPVTVDGETTTYVFCNTRHRDLWDAAQQGGRYGSTDPTRRSPLGIILPG